MRSLCLTAAVTFLCASPTFSQIDRLAQQLDGAFGRGDLGEYFDLFAGSSLHQQHQAQLRARFEELLLFKGITLETMVANQPTRGDVGIVVLETSVMGAEGSTSLFSYVAFRKQNDETQLLFTLEAPNDKLNVQAQSFSCPPCNFSIAFDNEWFAIPVRPAQSGCMEAMLLLSLKHDISLEAAVEVKDQAVDARGAISRFLAKARETGQLNETSEPVFMPWQPATIPDPMPVGMTSMRCVCQCSEGNSAELNLISVGQLQYLVVVRGPQETIDTHRADVDKVLDSFQLINPDLSASELSTGSIRAHTGGGSLEGSTYTNPTVKVSFSGPEGWLGSISAGSYIFKVDYQCLDSGSTLMVAAYEPPPGESWTWEPAGEFARRHFPRFETGAWQKKNDLLWCEAKTQDELFRVAIRSDVLLIMKGRATISVAKSLIQSAMTTLSSIR